jgi:hypothetical protein
MSPTLPIAAFPTKWWSDAKFTKLFTEQSRQLSSLFAIQFELFK